MAIYWFISLSLLTKYSEKNQYSPIQFAYPSGSDIKSYGVGLGHIGGVVASGL